MPDELTPLGESIEVVGSDIKLDKNVKLILAFKPVLARIFKESVSECAEMSFEEIEHCIEGEPSIDLVRLNPGTTNVKNPRTALP